MALQLGMVQRIFKALSLMRSSPAVDLLATFFMESSISHSSTSWSWYVIELSVVKGLFVGVPVWKRRQSSSTTCLAFHEDSGFSLPPFLVLLPPMRASMVFQGLCSCSLERIQSSFAFDITF